MRRTTSSIGAALGLSLAVCGCYRSHEAVAAVEPDAGAPTACEVRHFGATTVTCRVAMSSSAPCEDLGRCLCEAGALEPAGNGSFDSVDECLWTWIRPRALITLSDYCSPSASLSDAVRGFYADVVPEARVEVTAACDAIRASGEDG